MGLLLHVHVQYMHVAQGVCMWVCWTGRGDCSTFGRSGSYYNVHTKRRRFLMTLWWNSWLCHCPKCGLWRCGANTWAWHCSEFQETKFLGNSEEVAWESWTITEKRTVWFYKGLGSADKIFSIGILAENARYSMVSGPPKPVGPVGSWPDQNFPHSYLYPAGYIAVAWVLIGPFGWPRFDHTYTCSIGTI